MVAELIIAMDSAATRATTTLYLSLLPGPSLLLPTLPKHRL